MLFIPFLFICCSNYICLVYCSNFVYPQTPSSALFKYNLDCNFEMSICCTSLEEVPAQNITMYFVTLISVTTYI